MQVDEERLALSGLQHLFFCERQWGLIALEGLWQDDERTAHGNVLHERAHDIALREQRGSTRIVRAQPLYSERLGLYGVADIIEYRKGERGVPLQGRAGLWMPVPIEYKRGKAKRDQRDEVQVCAQAMCMEEMFGIALDEAYLFYHQTRTREAVALSAQLRAQVEQLSKHMHALYQKGVTPPPRKDQKICRLCSLKDLCMPKMPGSEVTRYVQGIIEQIEEDVP